MKDHPAQLTACPICPRKLSKDLNRTETDEYDGLDEESTNGEESGESDRESEGSHWKSVESMDSERRYLADISDNGPEDSIANEKPTAHKDPAHHEEPIIREQPTDHAASADRDEPTEHDAPAKAQDSTKQDDGGLDLRFLSTCREVNAEARCIPFEEHHFFLHSIVSLKWLLKHRKLRDRTSRIRYLSVALFQGMYGGYSDHLALQPLAGALETIDQRLSNLQSLTMVCHPGFWRTLARCSSRFFDDWGFEAAIGLLRIVCSKPEKNVRVYISQKGATEEEEERAAAEEMGTV